MTFKHGKFEDSVTMRSLVKVAEQKGCIKPELIQKQASVEFDLSPSASLTENVLKLCAGLRQSGMSKQADEVENNFFNYKRADGLYDISGEEGKDLVDAAHPDGSHKMENLEGDAVIETIVDQHLKDMEVVDKKPTAKLDKASSILQAVKLALGQKLPPSLTSLISAISIKLDNLVKQAEAEKMLPSPTNMAYVSTVKSNLMEATVYSLNKAKNLLPAIIDRYSPSFTGAGVSDYTWKFLEPQFNDLFKKIDQAIEIRKQYDQQTFESQNEEAPASPKSGPTTLEPVQLSASPLTPLFRQLNQLLGKLQSWQSIGSISKNPQASSWISKEIGVLKDIYARYDKDYSNEQEKGLVSAMTKEISSEAADINAFQQNWIS